MIRWRQTYRHLVFLFLRTVLLLIRIFLEYCQCVNDIPSIATDMLTRLSDLLKVRSAAFISDSIV